MIIFIEKLVHIWYILIMNAYESVSTPEYDEWEESQPARDRLQIAKRISLIEENGHFGDHHSVSDDNSVWELRWANGRRVYYAYLVKQKILLLLGGSKNGQKKDIKRAQSILSKNI
jgi:putative addiction module killer protein